KRLFTGGIWGQDHCGGGIAQQIHGGMEFDSRRFDHSEASGKHFAQAVMDGKGAAILNDNMAKLSKGAALGKAEHYERHIANEPFCHSTSEIGKVGLGHLVIEGFVGDGGAP